MVFLPSSCTIGLFSISPTVRATIRSKCALIRNQGGGSMTIRVSRLHDPVNAPFEKHRFGCSVRKTNNLAGKRFRQEMDPSKDLQNKFLPRHRTRGWEGINKEYASLRPPGEKSQTVPFSCLTGAEQTLIRKRGRRFELATFSR